METQIEQNYMEDVIHVLTKEQDELLREISILDESISQSTDEPENYEEWVSFCHMNVAPFQLRHSNLFSHRKSALIESLDTQLNTVKEKVVNLAQKINDMNKHTDKDNENPVSTSLRVWNSATVAVLIVFSILVPHLPHYFGSLCRCIAITRFDYDRDTKEIQQASRDMFKKLHSG